MNQESNATHWPDGIPEPERSRLVQITRDAWRELGFWYDCDLRARCWRFRADRKGVSAIAAALKEHLTSAGAGELGEHLHLGPYSHLRITTWDRPLLNERGILGRAEDFEQLIRELDCLAVSGATGVHPLAESFLQQDGFRATITVEPDGFDPGWADPMINGQTAL